MNVKDLISKIRSKSAGIAVIGLGHIGLPIALSLAKAGFRVVGVDSDKKKIRLLKAGTCYLKERHIQNLLKAMLARNRFLPTSNFFHALDDSRVVIVCVQTPMMDHRKLDRTSLNRVVRTVGQNPLEGKLVVIASTMALGMTESTIVRSLQALSGLRCGKDFWLAYCPERMAPGKSLEELRNNTRIVAGFNKDSTLVATELLKSVTKGGTVVSSIAAAEIAKLAENSFRDVNIAFANELALICERRGVDVLEVVRIANTHPRVRNIHKPGYGVGGPCLPRDAYLLTLPSKEKPLPSVILTSREVNDLMPFYAVERIEKMLKEEGKSLSNAKIGVLGVAYKGGTGDVRNSPAEPFIRTLLKRRAEVLVYDPYTRCTFGARRVRTFLEIISSSDCVAVLADHKEFLKTLTAYKSEKHRPILFDGRGIFDPRVAESAGFRYVAIGYGRNERCRTLKASIK